MKTIEDLEKDVKNLRDNLLILACVCFFTEFCDLIELLVKAFGGN